MSSSRDMKMMREQVDGLLRLELHALGTRPFHKEHVAKRITTRYQLPGKNDPRVWHLLYAFASGRLSSILHAEREAGRRVYECYTTPEGRRWQVARALNFEQFRSVVKDYQERHKDLGAKVEFLLQVLAEAERRRLSDGDSIEGAWRAVVQRDDDAEAA